MRSTSRLRPMPKRARTNSADRDFAAIELLLESHIEDGYLVQVGRDSVTGVEVVKSWLRDGVPHHEEHPAMVVRDRMTGNVVKEEWYIRGKRCRADGGPTVVEYDPVTGHAVREAWIIGTIGLHRTDGPAAIRRDPVTGAVVCEQRWRDGALQSIVYPDAAPAEPRTSPRSPGSRAGAPGLL